MDAHLIHGNGLRVRGKAVLKNNTGREGVGGRGEK
jgi:hypothetical protein